MGFTELQSTKLTEYGITSQWFKETSSTRNLLIVYAHPDDESFISGGTIARYSASGVAVHYVCATLGECGSTESVYLKGYNSIQELRTSELTCAAQALGLTAIHFLGYRDSGMRGAPDNQNPRALIQAPTEQVIGQIVALIRSLQPQVIVAHGPYGEYGHPDHVMIHRVVNAAFTASGEAESYSNLLPDIMPWKPSKLYCSTVTQKLLLRTFVLILRLWQKDPRRFGVNEDVDLVETIRYITPITTSIQASAYTYEKDQAWQCHRSQLGSMGLFARFPGPIRRFFSRTEHYTRAIPKWKKGEKKEKDFFAEI